MTYKPLQSENICFLLVSKTVDFALTHALINMAFGNHVLLCTKAQVVKRGTIHQFFSSQNQTQPDQIIVPYSFLMVRL